MIFFWLRNIYERYVRYSFCHCFISSKVKGLLGILGEAALFLSSSSSWPYPIELGLANTLLYSLKINISHYLPKERKNKLDVHQFSDKMDIVVGKMVLCSSKTFR